MLFVGAFRRIWREKLELYEGRLEVESYMGRIATPARRCNILEGKAVAKVVRRLA